MAFPPDMPLPQGDPSQGMGMVPEAPVIANDPNPVPSDFFAEEPDSYQSNVSTETQYETNLKAQKYAAEAKRNIAEDLDEDRLNKIGADCKHSFDIDVQTTRQWRNEVDQWIQLAIQARDPKNFPWNNASNIKFPLVSIAAMQFGARAYPTLVPSGDKIVKPVVYGTDADGSKLKRAQRVSKYMSWQLLYEMKGWEEDMDFMLLNLAIMGTMFKKTYYDPHCEQVKSELVDPREITINYFAKNMNEFQTISEHWFLYKREVIERQRSGVFLEDVDLGDPTMSAFEGVSYVPADTDDVPYFLVEQHCWIDLDDDDLQEPYVVTFERTTGKVLSIYPRYFPEDIKVRNGKIVSIKPCAQYTRFSFIPNPESKIYSLGFGHLLGPINESVNTIVNQLVDAGTLSNLQSGFIGKGLRLAKGEQILQPGQWKQVNAVGDDLRKQIVPLPANEPSNVLFQLLGFLVQSGKELASVAEIFVGKMPGQNTPATTTMASIEQGMKVFTAIYKRTYRALAEEFDKLYYLNSKYLDFETMVSVLDEPVNPQDFNTKDYNILPGADPTAVSSTERLMKAQGLLELLPLGTIDPIEVTKRVLEAQEQPDWEALIPGLKQTGQPQIPPPPPDPKMMAMEQKSAIDQQKAQMDAEKQQREMAMEESGQEAQLAMKAQENAMNQQHAAVMGRIEAESAQAKQEIFKAEARQKAQLRNDESKAKQKAAATPKKK